MIILGAGRHAASESIRCKAYMTDNYLINNYFDNTNMQAHKN